MARRRRSASPQSNVTELRRSTLSRVTKPLPAKTSKPAPKPSKQAPKPSKPAPKPSTSDHAPRTLLFEDAAAWHAWLETNHGTHTAGLWLKLSKKGSAVPSVSYDEALDGALCFGWIDGQRKSHDEHHFIQKFTPRRKASLWSKRNVDKVAYLVESGRMRPSGQAEIDAAKADGRWERAYAGSSTIAVHPDFEAALSRSAKARAFFDSLGKTQRYPFLWRIETAKKQETRQRKIQQFMELLEANKTL